jgi:hypothetical protein
MVKIKATLLWLKEMKNIPVVFKIIERLSSSKKNKRVVIRNGKATGRGRKQISMVRTSSINYKMITCGILVNKL